MTLESLVTAASAFSYSEIGKYAIALLEDDKKEDDEKMKYVRVTRSGGRQVAKKKRKENKLLLVYPFEVDEGLLSRCAADLTELGGNLIGLDDQPLAKTESVSKNKKMPSRRHNVTICEDDRDRLRPGQFLNDTLVDFWMQW